MRSRCPLCSGDGGPGEWAWARLGGTERHVLPLVTGRGTLPTWAQRPEGTAAGTPGQGDARPREAEATGGNKTPKSFCRGTSWHQINRTEEGVEKLNKQVAEDAWDAGAWGVRWGWSSKVQEPREDTGNGSVLMRRLVPGETAAARHRGVGSANKQPATWAKSPVAPSTLLGARL